MGLIGKIIGIVFLIIIVVLTIFILYEYFVNKGANICAAVSANPLVSLIFSNSCKCPNSDGKDPNGTCYTCPTIGSMKTYRSASAVTASDACWAGLTNCEKMYGSGSTVDAIAGVCYTCPNGLCRSIYSVTGDTACGPCGGVANSAAILNPLSVPAILTQSILF
jgi:hypothetical protein